MFSRRKTLKLGKNNPVSPIKEFVPRKNLYLGIKIIQCKKFPEGKNILYLGKSFIIGRSFTRIFPKRRINLDDLREQ